MQNTTVTQHISGIGRCEMEKVREYLCVRPNMSFWNFNDRKIENEEIIEILKHCFSKDLFTRCSCSCAFFPLQLDYIVTNRVIHTMWLWQWLWQWCHTFCAVAAVASCKSKSAATTPCEHFQLVVAKNPATATPCERTLKMQRFNWQTWISAVVIV